jgi:hypothetical protein
VLYGYKSGDGLLSITRGDVIDGAVELADGWSQCDTGSYPTSYVRPTALDVVVIAKEDFVASNKSHLGVRRGERLTLLARIAGYDWWYAVDARGTVGRVPIVVFDVIANIDEFRARAAMAASASFEPALPSSQAPPPPTPHRRTSAEAALRRRGSGDAMGAPRYHEASDFDATPGRWWCDCV